MNGNPSDKSLQYLNTTVYNYIRVKVSLIRKQNFYYYLTM